MSAADEIAEFYQQTVSVETYASTGAFGPNYATAVPVLCLVVDSYKSVRGANGEEVNSSAVLTTRPENAALFTPNSRVTIDARTAFVISTSVSQAGTLDLPAHCRVALT